MSNNNTPLSAIGDAGQAVDWFFMYKVSGKGTAGGGARPTGAEYVYFDASFSAGSQLVLSPHLITDASQGAMSNTLNQIYAQLNNPDLAWFFYNDENPLTGEVNGSRGHTKGVLCLDLATDSGFWLIGSAPKFPLKDQYGYPNTALPMAQTFLCITLKDAATARAIAAQMYTAQQPNVYLASAAPAGLPADDPFAALLKNEIVPHSQSYANFIQFESKAGQTFRCIAKNKHWNAAGDDDFYNDLVGMVLHESMEVETWEHDPEPAPAEEDKTHQIRAMKSVNLAPLGITPPYEWSEEDDHAKLAISMEDQSPKYVCVGDLNFTVAQEKRSGGTVAFLAPDLWTSLDKILSSTVTT